MFQNYIKIAFRNLWRQKGYTFINIAGLAIGFACCLLIALFVWHELSYDRFHDDVDRIHRVVSTWDDLSMPTTSLPLVERLQEDEPDVITAPLVRTSAAVRHEDRQFRESNIFFTPPSFFDVFSFRLLHGSANHVLSEPNQVVLTESTAEKYFGAENPIGKSLLLFGALDVEVSGITADVPANSHFQYDFLISWETLERSVEWRPHQGWQNNSIYLYMRLPEHRDAGAISERIRGIMERHAPAHMTATLSLQPMTSIHLHSNHQSELGANGRAAYVYLFICIALLILLIACMNYVNLSTARFTARAREVGVRKAVGAFRWQVAGQFLFESILLTLAAFLLAATLADYALPLLEVLAGREFEIGQQMVWTFIAGGIGFCFVIGLLSGIYPAVFLSGFSPTSVLYSQSPESRSQGQVRRGLVVFQITLSVILIVATIGMTRQLDYLRTSSVGFDQEQVVVVPGQSGQFNVNHEAFRDLALQSPAVLDVALASDELPSELLSGSGVRLAGTSDEHEISARRMLVSSGFFSTIGAEMAHGRDFSRDFPSDTAGFILNETAAWQIVNTIPDQISEPADLIGRELESGWERAGAGPVIGIVKDFHATTMHRAIPPIMFTIDPSYHFAYARVEAGRHTEALEALSAAWSEIYPMQPFEFAFADASYDAQYRAEERLSYTFFVFTLLAIFIACLGLFGLAAFAAERRRREIAIRKVMGATAQSIIALLSKDFLKLVVIGFVLAAPVAYYIMQRWLEDFAYRIEMGPGLFALAGLAVLTITLLTVSVHALRAALINPAEGIRN